jgi:hypothetical protein
MVERPKSSAEEFYGETLPYITWKLDRLLGEPPSEGKRTPVDCVAFGTSYVSVDEDNRVTAHHFSTCSHPKRGKQMGCVLVIEDDEGVITRIKAAVCEHRIKKGEKGCAKLEREIKTIEEESSPF